MSSSTFVVVLSAILIISNASESPAKSDQESITIQEDKADSVLNGNGNNDKSNDNSQESKVFVQMVDPPTEEEKRAEYLFAAAYEAFKGSNPNLDVAIGLMKEAAELNHSSALLFLAKKSLFGDSLPMNLSLSKHYFERLAYKGGRLAATAQLFLGFMYATGIGVEAHSAKSLIYYTISAAGGERLAHMIMGYRYWSRINVMQSCETALNYYRKIAKIVEQDHSFTGGTSIQRVRLYDEAENQGSYSGLLDDDLLQYYQFIADKGDIQAQVGLGQLHFQGGRGVEQDHQRAYNYFFQAANAGNANAMAFLGKMFLEGSPTVKQSNESALKYFEMSAEKGNPIGQSGLGLMYLYGKGVEKDYAKAFKYFTLAAKQGWVEGQLQLGLMFYNGLGVQRDFKIAIKYFTMASQSGHVLGFYNLAEMHATGTGTLRSCTTAVELFKNVAERGKWGTDLMKAHSEYRRGRTTEAFVLYSFLAELGYEVAQSNVAFMLDRHEIPILTRNETYRRAFMYWNRAAAQEYSVARVKLGDYYYYGYGTEVDYDLAAAQYRLAADQQHNAQALFNLGFMHEKGYGLRKDYHLAKRYYDMAAETNSDAQVPVALARLKLAFVTSFSSLAGINFEPVSFSKFNLIRFLGPDWDLYLMTALAVLLGFVVYLRRIPPA